MFPLNELDLVRRWSWSCNILNFKKQLHFPALMPLIASLTPVLVSSMPARSQRLVNPEWKSTACNPSSTPSSARWNLSSLEAAWNAASLCAWLSTMGGISFYLRKLLFQETTAWTNSFKSRNNSDQLDLHFLNNDQIDPVKGNSLAPSPVNTPSPVQAPWSLQG